MTKIKFHDADLNELATLNAALSAVKTERLNSNNTLDFSCRVKGTAATYLNENTICSLDGDYYDVAFFKSAQQANGQLLYDVQCEHISYRLNNPDFNVEYFTMTGSPTAILGAILADTGFSAGTVEFTTAITISLQEAASRRGLLMYLIAQLDGDLVCNGFQISIVEHRGSATPKPLVVGKNVTVVSKSVNKRNRDSQGNPIVSYACDVYKGTALVLGDAVTLDYDILGIDATLRVMEISYDPYNPANVSIEVGNLSDRLEDDIYRIETETVAKNKTYYGTRIGPEIGFETIRNDKKARSIMNADMFKMQKGDGSGTNWTDVLYFDAVTGEYVFDGKLSAGLISALEAEFDVTISNTVIVNNLTAAKGNIAELTVDELDTSDKVNNYKADPQIASDVNYIHIYDQVMAWVTAKKKETGTLPVYSRSGLQLYWTDETMTGVTEEANAYPVTTFDYDMFQKLKIYFDESDSNVPIIEMGVGIGDPLYPERGRGFISKDANGLLLKYIDTEGDEGTIRITDFVDAKQRRLKSCAINKSAGTITLGFEGTATTVTITYTESASGMSFTWPDGYNATVSIS